MIYCYFKLLSRYKNPKELAEERGVKVTLSKLLKDDLYYNEKIFKLKTKALLNKIPKSMKPGQSIEEYMENKYNN